MSTIAAITPVPMAVYCATAQRRYQTEQAALAARKARSLAHRAAAMLKERFGHAGRLSPMLCGTILSEETCRLQRP